MRNRDIKARAEELRDGYQEAMDEAFDTEFKDFLKQYELCDISNTITEDDVQDFMDKFDFPDEDTWVFTEVDNELAEIGDMKMEEQRDREMGL